MRVLHVAERGVERSDCHFVVVLPVGFLNGRILYRLDLNPATPLPVSPAPFEVAEGSTFTTVQYCTCVQVAAGLQEALNEGLLPPAPTFQPTFQHCIVCSANLCRDSRRIALPLTIY